MGAGAVAVAVTVAVYVDERQGLSKETRARTTEEEEEKKKKKKKKKKIEGVEKMGRPPLDVGSGIRRGGGVDVESRRKWETGYDRVFRSSLFAEYSTALL